MKIRNGFVSNSSSSSFVLLTTEENHQKVLETYIGEDKEIIELITKNLFKKKKIFGKDMLQGEGYMSDGEGWLTDIVTDYVDKKGDVLKGICMIEDDDDSYELVGKFEDIFNGYVNLLRKNEDEVFYNSDYH